MSSPTIMTIENRLGGALDHEHGKDAHKMALKIKNLMSGRLKAENLMTPESQIDWAIGEINKILDGYGVEYLKGKEWRRYWLDTELLYVNLDGPYAPTVIYDIGKEHWVICCWGDIVEKEPKRFGD